MSGLPEEIKQYLIDGYYTHAIQALMERRDITIDQARETKLETHGYQLGRFADGDQGARDGNHILRPFYVQVHGRVLAQFVTAAARCEYIDAISSQRYGWRGSTIRFVCSQPNTG